MHEASASITDNRGVGIPSPQMKNTFLNTMIPNKNIENPIPLTIPAMHFENFERSISVSDTMSSATKDCIIPNVSPSVNESQNINAIPLTRKQRLSLINTNVKEFSDSNSYMEVDSNPEVAGRKKTLPLNSSDDSNNVKPKKTANKVSTDVRESSDNDSSKTKTLYLNTDNPPYIVHVYLRHEDPNSGPAHPLMISRTLSRLAYSNIRKIKRIGRGKILAEMKTVKAANDLVQNPNLEKEKLFAFIPTYRTIRTGIVKDIPQYFDEAELLQYFESPFKVSEVKRLNRRIRINGEIKYIPSRTICLKFIGQFLPKYVFLCRNRYEVFPYIQGRAF